MMYLSVYDEARGLDDENLIGKANQEGYVLITNDKDFGELVFRMKKPHKGYNSVEIRG